jgi:predicted dienelactone hydrolase
MLMPSLIRIVAVAAVQFFVALTPARAATSGVGTIDDLKIQDSKRGKTLDARVNYPESGSGPYPLIVFSHGAGASKNDYQPLMRYWAAHGYVVMQVNHEDSGVEGMEQRSKAWSTRPGDLSALVDHVGDVEARVPALKGKIDTKHVGVAGHSFGGQTAQMMGGYKLRGQGGGRDDRVSAVVGIAPPGAGPGDSASSWSDIEVPMLTIFGTADIGSKSETPLWRADGYKNASSQDDYLILIDNADHLLGGISETRAGKPVPKNVDQFKLVADATTQFWDAYLRGDSAACNTFASGAVVASAAAPARFESKSGVRLRSASAPERVAFAAPSESMLQRYDVNGDGVMQRDEAPSRLPDRAFDGFDADGDGVLNEEEVQVFFDRLMQRGGGGRARGGGGRRAGGGGAAMEAPSTAPAPELPPYTETKSKGSAVCHRAST